MSRFLLSLRLVVWALPLMGLPLISSGQTVESVDPAPNSIIAQATDTLKISFDAEVSAATLEGDIRVYGSRSGGCEGTVENLDAETVGFIPDCPFWENEVVTTTVTDDNIPESYSWQFTVRTEHGNGEFEGQPLGEVGAGTNAETKTAVNEVETSATGTFVLPSAPYAGDLDESTTTDVAVVNQEQNQLVVLFNEGGGTFDQEVLPEPTGVSMTGVVGGDLTGNGLPDLITFNTLDNSISIYANEGNRAFAEPEEVSTGSRPVDVALADFDRNGTLDVAVSAFGSDEVTILYNDGSLNFTPDNIDVGAAPISLTARDMNRDGAVDLVLSSAGEEQIEHLENDGTGAFSRETFGLSFTPGAVVANDVLGNEGGTYGDGWTDLVVADRDEKRAVAYRNDETDGFSFTQESEISLPGGAQSMLLSDIDTEDPEAESLGLGEDGTDYDLDLISTHLSEGVVASARNEANGEFEPTSSSIGGEQLGDPAGVVSLDLGPLAGEDVARSGDQDLLVVNTSGTQYQVFENEAPGRESPISVEPLEVDCGDVCVGENNTRAIEVTNESVFAVTLDPTIETPGGIFSLVDDSPIELEPGESEEIEVVFAPDQPDDFTNQLILNGNIETEVCGDVQDREFERSVPLEGTGESTEVDVAPDTINFSTVEIPNTKTESFVISNDGNIEADIEEFEDPESPFDVSSGEPTSIAAGGERTVQVSFEPESEGPGQYEDEVSLRITDSCGEDTTFVVVLQGEADPEEAFPDLDASTPELEEGEDPLSDVVVGGEREFACTVENNGEATVQESFDVSIERDGSEVESESFSGLNVGESVTLSPVLVEFPDEGQYEVSCRASEIENEVDTDNNVEVRTITVEVRDELIVEPNPFTPNGDGTNDTVKFRVEELGLSSPELVIFTIDGRRVKTVREANGGVLRWDGTDSDNQDQPPGVYLYVVRENGSRVSSGHVTLAR